MQLVVALGVFLEIIVKTLRMSHYRVIALNFQVKQELVKLPRLLNERIFHEDIPVRKSGDLTCGKLRAEKIVDTVLRRTRQVNIYTRILQGILQLMQCRVKHIGSVPEKSPP